MRGRKPGKDSMKERWYTSVLEHSQNAHQFSNTEPIQGVLLTSYHTVSLCMMCASFCHCFTFKGVCVFTAPRPEQCWGNYMQRIGTDSSLILIIMPEKLYLFQFSAELFWCQSARVYHTNSTMSDIRPASCVMLLLCLAHTDGEAERSFVSPSSLLWL